MSLERRRALWKLHHARHSVEILYPTNATNERGGTYSVWRRRSEQGRTKWAGLVNSPDPSDLALAARGTQEVDARVSLEWGAPVKAGDVLKVNGYQYEVKFADVERDGLRLICDCGRIEDVEIVA